MGDPRYSGPRVFEWFVLVASLMFVACGLLLLGDKPDVAVPCLAFFGACAALAAHTIARKRRFARTSLLSVEIVGGVRIRPSRLRLALLGATLLGLGLILMAYLHTAPFTIVLCMGVMIVTGAVVLLGILTGYLPVGFLQFDPSGITIGGRGDSFMVPWDSIAAVTPGEFNDNAVLLLSIRDLDSIIVRPAQAHARVVAKLESSVKWVGAHVMIMSSQFGIELPHLVQAIERYIADPQARQGLAIPRLPAGPA